MVGASCTESALGLLQGPHGREVRAAVLALWSETDGPPLIAALRRDAPDLPIIVLANGGSDAEAEEYTSKLIKNTINLAALRAAALLLLAGGLLMLRWFGRIV